MASFSNGQCSYRSVYGGRCLELATHVREWRVSPEVIYEIGLCFPHFREDRTNDLRRQSRREG